MSTRNSDKTPTPWRPAYTTGGALGVWSHGCKTDAPDVCTVAMVPDATDETRARLIAAAPQLLNASVEAENWLDHHGGDPAVDDGLRGLLLMLRSAIADAQGPQGERRG